MLTDEVKPLDIPAAQEAVIGAFNEIGDIFAQYTLLIEVSSAAPALSEEELKKAVLVDKCQSQVWIDVRPDEKGFHMAYESDTLIIRGVLGLMAAILENSSLSEVEEFNLEFVSKTELHEAFSSERLSGFSAIVQVIKEQASLKMGA